MRQIFCRLAICIAALLLAPATRNACGDDIVQQAMRIIRQHELMHPDPASLAQGSPEALLISLQRVDPAAQWWSPNVASANRDWTGESIVGIGASVISDGSRVLFLPLPDGPLTRAGITQPVQVVALDGQSADRLSLESVQQVLGDPAIDPVGVTVQDLISAPAIHLVLKRGTYEAVSAERIDTHRGPLLRVHRFVKGLTRRQFREALDPILSASQPVVVDLRYSVGGDLYEALDTASLFLAPGLKLATLQDATGRRTELKSVGSGPIGDGLITILVGPATISASEVFAAALRDNGKARLIGTPTFGKCLAQSSFRMIDGSVLVVSTGRILSPLDWYCDGKGLLPDIQIDRANADNTDALMARIVR
jgi:carboxyl-terminal processing protease